MKPYVSEILQNKGKTYKLPIPAKYRELLDCAHTLGIKDAADEKDMKLVGYETLIVPSPDECMARCDVEQTATLLSNLNVEQVQAIGALCGAFSLQFRDITGVICAIDRYLGGCDNEN